jgi:pimeloyl-ACP methyl ester carboxylesterase
MAAEQAGTDHSGTHSVTHLVVGRRDKLTPPSHARRLRDGIPGARVTVVPGTGHMTPMERPEAPVVLLTDLIDSATPKPGVPS